MPNRPLPKKSKQQFFFIVEDFVWFHGSGSQGRYLLIMTIAGLYERFERLNTDDVIEQALTETSEQRADLNAEQMFTGVESTGDEINPAYAFSTVQIKRQKGQPSDRVTLRDTGDFYRGVYSRVEGDEVVISSTDSKTGKLVEKYGPDIFGLNSTFKREYLGQSLGPVLRGKISDLTGLKFG